MQYGVTVTPHGLAGWTGPANTLTEFIVLAQTDPGAPLTHFGNQHQQLRPGPLETPI
jgi:hypothetical protein